MAKYKSQITLKEIIKREINISTTFTSYRQLRFFPKEMQMHKKSESLDKLPEYNNRISLQ